MRLAFASLSWVFLSLAACGGSEPADKGSPVAGAGAAERQQFPTGRLDRSKAGTPAPAVLFRDPSGEPASLADFRGKPVLVNLWATWCAPCVAEMPTLDALALRKTGVEVLALSQDIGGAEKVDAFFEARKFKALEAYVDPELAFMTGLGISTLPTTILYDASGKEVWRMTGMEDWTAPRAAKLLKEASPEAAR